MKTAHKHTITSEQLSLPLTQLEKDIKSALKRQRVKDMIAHYNAIMAKKTPGGACIHSIDYALEQCERKYYLTKSTCSEYIRLYSE